MTDPTRINFPIGEVRKWLHRFRVFFRDRRLSLRGIESGMPIYISNQDGRLDTLKKLQAVVRRVGDGLNGRLLVLGKSDLELNDDLLQFFSELDVCVLVIILIRMIRGLIICQWGETSEGESAIRSRRAARRRV